MPRRNRHDPRPGESLNDWDARLMQTLRKLSAKRGLPVPAQAEDVEPIDLDDLDSSPPATTERTST